MPCEGKGALSGMIIIRFPSDIRLFRGSIPEPVPWSWSQCEELLYKLLLLPRLMNETCDVFEVIHSQRSGQQGAGLGRYRSPLSAAFSLATLQRSLAPWHKTPTHYDTGAVAYTRQPNNHGIHIKRGRWSQAEMYIYDWHHLVRFHLFIIISFNKHSI